MKKKIVAALIAVAVTGTCAGLISACGGHEHAYADNTVAPTCTEQGYTTHTCECGDTYTDSYVEALGHDYEIDSEEADCTKGGYIEKTCKREGCDYSSFEILAKGEHTLVTDSAVAKTCTTDGLTEGSHCAVCGEVIVAQQKVLASHNIVTDVAIAATCTEEGLTEGSHCDECGVELVAQNVVAKIPHNVNGKNFCLTCNEDVSTPGLICSLNADGKSYKVTAMNEAAGATNVYIPAEYEGLPVTVIGKDVFRYNRDGRVDNLKSVFIPDTVTTIEAGAFANCKFENISIPDSVVSVDSSAFASCVNLNFNKYQNGLYLGNADNPYLVLYKLESKKITEFTTHNDTKIVVEALFEYCEDLTSVTLSNKIVSIPDYFFYECTGLINVTLGNGLKSIGMGVFDGCSSLTFLEIPSTVEEIGIGAFSSCSKLATLSLPYIGENKDGSGNSMLGHAFKYTGTAQNDGYVRSALKTLIITNATVIGKDALNSCKYIETVVLCDTITSIEANAFKGCTALKNVFYTGNADKWSEISINSQSCLVQDKVLYYSKSKPEENAQNYWHYVDGSPVAWE